LPNGAKENNEGIHERDHFPEALSQPFSARGRKIFLAGRFL
jgi:hypothetical protein